MKKRLHSVRTQEGSELYYLEMSQKIGTHYMKNVQYIHV